MTNIAGANTRKEDNLVIDMEVSPIEQSPGRRISRAHLLLKLGLARVFAQAGFNLTPEHWALLSILWEKDGLRQTELAALLFKDRPNTTRMIDVLERNGFVGRHPDPTDRRGRLVFLTGEGRAIRDALTTLTREYLQRAFSTFSREEYDEFMRLNEKLTARLNQLPELKTGEEK
jgi:MarR family transcriptional regulator, organic hydroperoxide resistance regulator